MYLPTVDGKYFWSDCCDRRFNVKLLLLCSARPRTPAPPSSMLKPRFEKKSSPRRTTFNIELGVRGRRISQLMFRLFGGGVLQKYFPSTVLWAGLSLPPNIQKSGPTRSIYNASEWNALGVWRQCFLHPVCFHGFSKAARPQNHQAGHLEYNTEDPIFITILETDITKIQNKKMQEGCIEIVPHSTTIWSGSNKRCTLACNMYANIFVAQKTASTQNSLHFVLCTLLSCRSWTCNLSYDTRLFASWCNKWGNLGPLEFDIHLTFI